MGDDFSRDDPHVGPEHLPGADVGASLTIDDQGHVRAVDVTVPAGEGSDPLHWEPGGHDAGSTDPGWMPHVHDPAADVPLPDINPPLPGWTKNPFDGKWYPPGGILESGAADSDVHVLPPTSDDAGSGG